MRMQPLPLTLAALVVALVPLTVSAVTKERKVMQVASGLCGANNPVNDQYLRRLPSGLRNSGTVTISVVCSQWGDENGPDDNDQTFVYFKNDKAVAYNVTCTLSQGVPFYGQIASTKTISVPAGGQQYLTWGAADFGTGSHAQFANLQCSVPQAFTMREIGSVYFEDVGT